MAIVIRLLHYLVPYRRPLAGAFGLALLGALVELARPWPVKIAVDYALGGQPLPPPLTWLQVLPGAASPAGLLVWCVAGGLAIVAGAAACATAGLRALISVAQRMVYDLARELFEKLQRLSLSFHGRHNVGDLLQRVSADVFVVHMAVSQVAVPAIVSLISLAGMFVIMAGIDLSLALVAISVAPLLTLALALYARPIDVTATRQYAAQSDLMALVGQSLGAIKAIQGFAREPYVQAKVDARAQALGAAYNDATRVSGGYKELTEAITGAAAAALLGLGGLRVLEGRLSLGDLFIFLGYLAALYGPVHALANAVGAAVAVGARGRRIFEVLDAVEEIAERPGARALGPVRGEVLIEAVSFGYGEPGQARPVLREVSLRARPGQIIAIVGATGAGKSSLVALLSRFYDPWAGRICLDGVDLRDLTLASLRENVALVLQEPALLHMSVADNIAFGRPGASRAELLAAARAARAHEFIERLPQGYDTLLGEAGVSLSGGERQRIAIARALLKDAPVLVLDEPTSALDAHTEGLIFEAIAQLLRDRTVFIISHRLSTIRRADQILALDDGRIVERGSHDDLLAAGQVYAGLYRRQHIAAL